MKLLVVILNYKVTRLTIDCLRSLRAELERHPEYHVAVLDNGTGADAVEELRRAIAENGWGAWVTLSAVSPNRGFTGGNNVVLREALASPSPPEYLLLLNADTLVHDGALTALVDAMDRRPRAGIGGSTLLTDRGEVQESAFRFPGIAAELDRGLRLGVVSKLLARWAVVPPQPREEAPAEWLSGASMILRRTMLEEIGLLDEGLFMYYEDVDLCLRARRAGWERWYVPGSRVVHLEGASTGITQRAKRRPTYWFQARRRFFLKSFGAVYTALADACFIAGFALWRVRRAVQRKPDTDPPDMLWESIRHSVFLTGFRVTEVPNPALAARGGGGGGAGGAESCNSS